MDRYRISMPCPPNPSSHCGGPFAGSMTDPPALTFANAIKKSDSPSVAYATMYPLRILLRIIIAQTLVLLLAQ